MVGNRRSRDRVGTYPVARCPGACTALALYTRGKMSKGRGLFTREVDDVG